MAKFTQVRGFIPWNKIDIWLQGFRAYMEKYVDPHSGAKAMILDMDHLYRVDVQRIMIWEYGTVGSRTNLIKYGKCPSDNIALLSKS